MALKIILGVEYQNYDDALVKLNLETLEKRRMNICLKFAKTIEKSENSLIGYNRLAVRQNHL